MISQAVHNLLQVYRLKSPPEDLVILRKISFIDFTRFYWCFDFRYSLRVSLEYDRDLWFAFLSMLPVSVRPGRLITQIIE